MSCSKEPFVRAIDVALYQGPIVVYLEYLRRRGMIFYESEKEGGKPVLVAKFPCGDPGDDDLSILTPYWEDMARKKAAAIIADVRAGKDIRHHFE